MNDIFKAGDLDKLAEFNEKLRKNLNCLFLVVHKHWEDIARGGPEHWQRDQDLYLGRINRVIDPKKVTFDMYTSASFPGDLIAYVHMGEVRIERDCGSFPNRQFMAFIMQIPFFKEQEEMAVYIPERGNEFPVATDRFICTLDDEIADLTKAFLNHEAKLGQETGSVAGAS